MLPGIFIGGTGRSGTGILHEALGCHEAIFALAPGEMRFLIDPDGLISLVDTLTVRYSPVQAREALFRFERLMNVYLTVSPKAPYKGYDLAHCLGGEYYWRRLDEFCDELTDLEYDGTDLQVEPEHNRLMGWAREVQRNLKKLPCLASIHTHTRLSMPRTKLKVVKYFPDRTRLMKVVATFVGDLFRHAAKQRGKETWCEKTPLNILHIDFLWELFPESAIIHIKRDPRGVVYSLNRQFWAPHDVRGACMFLKGIYDHWFNLKSKIDLDKHRYLEVKLEDLAAAPRAVLEQITFLCGVDNNFINLPNIRLDKVDYWKEEMPKTDKELVTTILGSYIEMMDYVI